LSLYIEECVVRGVVSGITIACCTYTSPDIITAVIIYTFLDSFEVTSTRRSIQLETKEYFFYRITQY
jgi:hypothetical protein